MVNTRGDDLMWQCDSTQCNEQRTHARTTAQVASGGGYLHYHNEQELRSWAMRDTFRVVYADHRWGWNNQPPEWWNNWILPPIAKAHERDITEMSWNSDEAAPRVVRPVRWR